MFVSIIPSSCEYIMNCTIELPFEIGSHLRDNFQLHFILLNMPIAAKFITMSDTAN